MAVEFWTMGRGSSSAGNPKFLDSASQAVRAEEVGYDGIVYVDSQNHLYREAVRRRRALGPSIFSA